MSDAVSVPSTMKALVLEEGGTAAVKDVPVPSLQDNEILVKVAWVSLNPTDWKHVAGDFEGVPGAISGCDFSGVVFALGPDLKNSSIKIGDEVSGMTHGGKFPDRGSMAEYTKVESDLVWHVTGAGGITLREAPQYAVAFITMCQILYTRQKVPYPPAKVSGDQWYLVYGGTTSVGLFAIQLAKLAGFKVVATASAKHFDLVKSYGADAVIDYHDSSASEKIREITGGTLKLGMDPVASGSSFKIALRAFAKNQGGYLHLTLPPSKEAEEIAAEMGVKMAECFGYSLLGHAFRFKAGVNIPAIPSDRGFYVKLNKDMDKFLGEYKIKPNPITVVDGGLEKGILDGFEMMKQGKVSAQKLHVQIS